MLHCEKDPTMKNHIFYVNYNILLYFVISYTNPKFSPQTCMGESKSMPVVAKDSDINSVANDYASQ